MTTHRVFVFGTLKQGFPNFATNRGVRVPGLFETVERWPLLLVGDRHSPWLMQTAGQGHHVQGQVFDVGDEVLADMDRLERVAEADGYRRVGIEVRRTDGLDATTPPTLQVHAYLKPQDQLQPDQVRLGPVPEYTLAHAALYRPRAD